MNKSTLVILTFAGLSLFAACKNSSKAVIKEKKQEEVSNKENRVSPLVTATATISGNVVTVAYSSPAVKGRKIWGELVPFGEVWRTGANEATTVAFSNDVTIQGQTLTKGIYSFFTIPTDTTWTIIFNLDETQWGAFKYDQNQDALRVVVQPITTETITENLSFSIVQDASPNNGIIRLNWEKLQLDCLFTSSANQ